MTRLNVARMRSLFRRRRPVRPGDAVDPWMEHWVNAGHSCGQVNDYFYCPTCGHEATRTKAAR